MSMFDSTEPRDNNCITFAADSSGEIYMVTRKSVQQLEIMLRRTTVLLRVDLWNTKSIRNVDYGIEALIQSLSAFITSDKGGGKCVCPRLSACLSVC